MALGLDVLGSQMVREYVESLCGQGKAVILTTRRLDEAERLCSRFGLLHQGQRDAVAADLFVHAQTVRYRMTQIRELYGDRLNDPQTVLELIVALCIPTTVGTGS